MSAAPLPDPSSPDESPAEVGSAASELSFIAAQNADIDAVAEDLAADARSWAAQLSRCSSLVARAQASGRGGDRRFLVLELAGSWRISQVTAGRWVEQAERMSEALPLTWELLEQGLLFRHQAQALLHRTQHCTVEIARQVEAELLPAARELCPSDLSKRIDRAVLRLESQAATAEAGEQRHARAAAKRRVWLRADADAMALVGAVLTAEQAVAFRAGLDRLERRERCADRTAGVDRTAEQRRADLFAALPAMVLAGTAQDRAVRDLADRDGASTSSTAPGGAPGDGGDTAEDEGKVPLRPWTLGPEQLAAQVVLTIHVPVATVLGLSREPGRLEGHGPVSAEHIRLVRPYAVRRVMVDGLTGRPVAVDDRTTPAAPDRHALRRQVRDLLRPDVIVDRDEAQHDPSARLARLVDVRDVHCSGPGCTSSHTDRDHHDPWPHGPTNAANLHRLSRRCHAAKHDRWTLRRHPDGSSTWTSPLRRTYSRPSPHQPPPQVDLYADPPAPRPRPTAGPPEQPDPDDPSGGEPNEHTPDHWAAQPVEGASVGPDTPHLGTARPEQLQAEQADVGHTRPGPAPDEDDPPPF